MRSAISGALFLLAAASACTPALTDGRYTCASDETCPPGWTCIDGRCRAPGAIEECRIDLHCDDGSVCTLDICSGGRCVHEPDTAATDCDDGLFCNGPDACVDGTCAPSGVVPCVPCDESAPCSDCGASGQTCCEGMSCQGAAACDETGMCVRCGTAVGEPCCADGVCGFPESVCAAGGCALCGEQGQPCCPGGGCNPPFACNPPGICDVPPGCEDAMNSCPPGEVCVAGGTCTACGTLGSPCCLDSETSCREGECRPSGFCGPPCGELDEECCIGPAPCEPGMVCATPPDGSTGMGERCVTCGVRGAPCCDPIFGFFTCIDPGLECTSDGTCQPCMAGACSG